MLPVLQALCMQPCTACCACTCAAGRAILAPSKHHAQPFPFTVQDFILRSAARLNLPIKWVPDRIAEQNFNLEEPPTTASAWVGVMLKHLQTFRQRLSTMPTLTTRDVDQVRPRWRARVH